MHRYIDLRSKTWYNYFSFSDTANLIDKGHLPDSVFTDYGWSYFSDKALQIMGTPRMMLDTVIQNITYKKAKFHFIQQDSSKNYQIGLFRCDGKGNLFSLEKQFSRFLNCTMTKLYTYRGNSTKPYGSIEIDFVSDDLSPEQMKVFAAWAENAKKYSPVK